jgi:valyl-tRNA synthetase
LLHPIVPFVTEQLWRSLTGRESIVIAEWPSADDALVDRDAEAGIVRLQGVVTEVRRFRAEQGLRPGQKVSAAIVTDDDVLLSYLAEFGALTDLTPESQASAPDGWPVLTVGTSRIAVDLSDAIDVAAERARLTRDLESARKEVAIADAKLANTDFLAKAPDAVVGKMRQRRAAAEADIARVTGQLDALPAPTSS